MGCCHARQLLDKYAQGVPGGCRAVFLSGERLRPKRVQAGHYAEAIEEGYAGVFGTMPR